MAQWEVVFNPAIQDFFIIVGFKCPFCTVIFEKEKITTNCYLCSPTQCIKDEWILLRIQNLSFYGKKLVSGEFDPDHTSRNYNDPLFIRLGIFMDANTILINAFWKSPIILSVPDGSRQIQKSNRFNFTNMMHYAFVWPKN
jgi:hypothetical protein